MQFLKSVNQTLAFLLKLGMFFSVSYWGVFQGKNTFSKWKIEIICLAITITLWVIFAAPNSQRRLAFSIRLVFEFTMFLFTSFLLYKLNRSTLSICFALLSIASVTIAFIFKQ